MPTTFPTNPRIANTNNITFIKKVLGTSFQSPFNGKTQMVKYSGEYWELDLQFNPLLQADAEELMAFIANLDGMDGTFYYKLPNKFLYTTTTPQTITITGDGSTFTGMTGQPGKFAYCDSRLVMFKTTSSLFPRLSIGSKTLDRTSGALFRLNSNEQTFTVDAAMMGKYAMGIRESI
jgi:hypothetical protein